MARLAVLPAVLVAIVVDTEPARAVLVGYTWEADVDVGQSDATFLSSTVGAGTISGTLVYDKDAPASTTNGIFQEVWKDNLGAGSLLSFEIGSNKYHYEIGDLDAQVLDDNAAMIFGGTPHYDLVFAVDYSDTSGNQVDTTGLYENEILVDPSTSFNFVLSRLSPFPDGFGSLDFSLLPDSQWDHEDPYAASGYQFFTSANGDALFLDNIVITGTFDPNASGSAATPEPSAIVFAILAVACCFVASRSVCRGRARVV